MRNWIDMSYLPTGGITRDMSDQASPTRILTSSNLRRARFRFRVPVFPLRTNLSEFRGLPLARFLRKRRHFSPLAAHLMSEILIRLSFFRNHSSSRDDRGVLKSRFVSSVRSGLDEYMEWNGASIIQRYRMS